MLLCVTVADILDAHGNGPGVIGQQVQAQPGVVQQAQHQATSGLGDSVADLDNHSDEPGVSGQPVQTQPGVAQQVQDQAAQLKQVCCQSEESPPVTLNSPSDHTQLSLSDF